MVNKVILIGNLGADPEIRYTQSGTPVANFNLATSETWRNQDGTKEERTEWHRIVAWRRLAEICGEYLNKGTRVYIEGSIRTRKWEDRDGNPRYTTEIEAREMKILSPRSGGGGGEYGGGGGSSYAQEQSSYEPPPGVGDDVPF
ncbi:single-stranded DNA-binding protein [Desulfolithobacter sp.]